VAGALVGYVTFQSIFAAIRKAQTTDTERLVAALEALKVETPIGAITYRPFDHQSTMGAWVGTTRRDAARGVAVMSQWEYVPGEKVLPSEAEVRRMRESGK
jgi:branched-chain amino acid transport system substrate-binding protein